MSMTISEAAEAKGISRNAVWLAINRDLLTTRKTSGGLWLIEQDGKWEAYRPRPYPRSGRGSSANIDGQGGEQP